MTDLLLNNLLKPISDFLNDENIAEISINKCGSVWLERFGKMQEIEVPELTFQYLKDLAKLIATYTEQVISEEHPLLSAFLPNGCRVQVVFAPAVCDNSVAFSIRKSTHVDANLDWTLKDGSDCKQSFREQFIQKYDSKEYLSLLELSVKNKLNILISGGTSTGKTSLLNTLLNMVPLEERIITIEDVPEILIKHPNHLSLYASRNKRCRSLIDMQDLVEASLRLRPDRLIMGEFRGKEAFSFLRAINTGHPGSMATLHADTPILAIEQLVLMVMQNGLGLTRDHIMKYVRNILDIIVQLKKDDISGRRYISDVYCVKEEPLE